MTRSWVVLLAMLVALFPRELRAQNDPSVTSSLQPNEVRVGEPFTVQLSVTTEAGAPSASDPRLAVPDGLRASPPSVSTQTSFTFMNGRTSRRSGFTAT